MDDGVVTTNGNGNGHGPHQSLVLQTLADHRRRDGRAVLLPVRFIAQRHAVLHSVARTPELERSYRRAVVSLDDAGVVRSWFVHLPVRWEEDGRRPAAWRRVLCVTDTEPDTEDISEELVESALLALYLVSLA